MESAKHDTTLEHVTSIIAAYVSNNTIQRENLPALIQDTFSALSRANQPEAIAEELVPAVSIKRSVQPEYIVCLEDGKQFKSLKRHLMTSYSMTPDEYRQKWGLPYDYPMVAPNYAAARSELAKKSGLGRREEQVVVAAPAAVAKAGKKKTATTRKAKA
jgi:predicted transcriptional regulator